MYVFRLKTPLSAVVRDDPGMKIVTLAAGTTVRTRKAGPRLPGGLVDVIVDGRELSMFAQDLEDRAERIDDNSA
jgi:hypothetical protein